MSLALVLLRTNHGRGCVLLCSPMFGHNGEKLYNLAQLYSSLQSDTGEKLIIAQLCSAYNVEQCLTTLEKSYQLSRERPPPSLFSDCAFYSILTHSPSTYVNISQLVFTLELAG